MNQTLLVSPIILWLIQKNPVSDGILFTEPYLYYMFFQLKMVLSTTPSFPQDQSFFTFQEVTQLTTYYIYAKRHSLIDFRNPFVCLVSKDPLGTVFMLKPFIVHNYPICFYVRLYVLNRMFSLILISMLFFTYTNSLTKMQLACTSNDIALHVLLHKSKKC
jgi:hypothetical protein